MFEKRLLGWVDVVTTVSVCIPTYNGAAFLPEQLRASQVNDERPTRSSF